MIGKFPPIFLLTCNNVSDELFSYHSNPFIAFSIYNSMKDLVQLSLETSAKKVNISFHR